MAGILYEIGHTNVTLPLEPLPILATKKSNVFFSRPFFLPADQILPARVETFAGGEYFFWERRSEWRKR